MPAATPALSASRHRVPTYIASSAGAVFAVFHPVPEGLAALPLAVLLCPPFGAEDSSAHRSWHELADALAARGVACLRFDYPGCGDSCPLGREEDLTPAWLVATQACADWLRQASGAPRLGFIGHRMGSLIAQSAVGQRRDVAALVQVAPVRSGQAYVRELKMLAGTTAAQGLAHGMLPGAVVAAGFVLNAATLDGLRQMKVPAQLGVDRLCVIDRDDMPLGEAVWQAIALPQGAVRRYVALPGFAQLMVTAHEAQMAAPIREAITQALLTSVTQGLPTQAGQPVTMRQQTMWVDGSAVLEAIARPIGPLGMQGIWSEPAPGEPRSGQALLILNSSAERRIGPNGMWVRMARERAARGDLVLRLDFPALGESDADPNATGHRVYPDRVTAYLSEALAELQRHAPGAMLSVLGLCSGAYHALHAAVQGLPVKRAFIVNPLLFRLSPGEPFDLHVESVQSRAIADKALQRARDPQRWLKLLRGGVDVRGVLTAVFISRKVKASTVVKRVLRDMGLIPHLPLAQDLRRAVKARIHLHFFFADTDPGAALAREATGGVYQRLLKKRTITEDLVSQGDHTFGPLRARNELFELIHQRLDEDRISDSVLSTRWYASVFK